MEFLLGLIIGASLMMFDEPKDPEWLKKEVTFCIETDMGREVCYVPVDKKLLPGVE